MTSAVYQDGIGVEQNDRRRGEHLKSSRRQKRKVKNSEPQIWTEKQEPRIPRAIN